MAGQRKSEARRWYQQAVYDLKAARWNIEGGFHDTACFLGQQSAEKALKSLLYYLGERRTALMTHALVEMIGGIGDQADGLTALMEDARVLDLHYVPARYPNGLPSGYPHQFYGHETSERAVKAAERILAIVTGHFRSQGEEEILTSDE